MTTQRELRRDTDPLLLRALGGVRRLAITATAKVLWQFTGARMPDGADPFSIEVFPGIGFFARPASSGRPEAVSVNLGADAKAPVVVATRDEATRSKSAGDLAADESAMFNTRARVHVKADGTIEIRGVPQVLAPEKLPRFETYRTAEDAFVNALRTFLIGLDTMITAMSTDVALLAVAPATYAAAGVLQPLFVPLFTALGAFQAAAATYLARVGKVE